MLYAFSIFIAVNSGMLSPLKRRHCIMFILCITGCFNPFVTFSQISESAPYYWKIQHISTETGLSNRFANCIMGDDRGFAWIGTNFGLNRYDGHRIDDYPLERNQHQRNYIQQLKKEVNKNI